MGSKTPQIISHNYIKIMGQNTKTLRALKFINKFLSEHQLVRKIQQYCIYNRKEKIIIQ